MTIRRLFTISSKIRSLKKAKFDQKIQYHEKRITLEPSVEDSIGFCGDTVVTVFTFVFGAITSGVLSEIDLDIWSKIKKACHSIVSKSAQTRVRTMTHLKAEFHLSNSEGRIEYIIKGLSLDSIDTFWDKTH